LLTENLGGAEVELTVEEIHDLNDALSKIEILGERYPAEYANRMGKKTQNLINRRNFLCKK